MSTDVLQGEINLLTIDANIKIIDGNQDLLSRKINTNKIKVFLLNSKISILSLSNYVATAAAVHFFFSFPNSGSLCHIYLPRD